MAAAERQKQFERITGILLRGNGHDALKAAAMRMIHMPVDAIAGWVHGVSLGYRLSHRRSMHRRSPTGRLSAVGAGASG